jgi:hypothetical protein
MPRGIYKHKPNQGFQKGHTVGRMNKGVKLSKEHKIKIGIGNFRGESAGYMAKHIWVKNNKGIANNCIDCKESGKNKYEWSNVDHKYRRVLEDYVSRCTQCHRIYDRDVLKIKVGR